ARLPIFSPVGSDAAYTPEAGHYAGMKVPGEANKAVLADLKANGSLMHSGTVHHSYPYCWRCGNKLIFLATKQWFMNVKRMKNRLLKQNQKIKWYPPETQKWEDDILTNSPDWCISRQRYWGIPMPIWVCAKCGSKSVIGSKQELEKRATNPEYIRFMDDLHRPHIDKAHVKCECGGSMDRIPDVFDVWWDSSIAFRAGIPAEQFGKFLATELVLEYVEQIRGWFQAMLKAGMMVYGKNPMRNVVVHGILFGKDGKKLSKSLGNYSPLDDMLKFATADAFRLWATLTNPILNRTLNEQAMQAIKDSEKVVNILHNASKLLSEYEELLKYKPAVKKINPKGLDSIDEWMVSRLESVTEAVTRHLDGYEAYKAAAVLKDFIVEDFSRFYIKLAKKRIL
ncbi:MAG: class I tRNA ligase family protein, partial [Candidatus Micrarchaeaceae archaeon]